MEMRNRIAFTASERATVAATGDESWTRVDLKGVSRDVDVKNTHDGNYLQVRYTDPAGFPDEEFSQIDPGAFQFGNRSTYSVWLRGTDGGEYPGAEFSYEIVYNYYPWT